MIALNLPPEPVSSEEISARQNLPVSSWQNPLADTSFQRGVRSASCSFSDISSSDVQVYLVPLPFKNGSSSYIVAFDEDYSRLVSRLPWVADFFENAVSANDVASLLPYYSHLNELMVEKDFVSLDDILNQIKVQQLSDVLLVGVLRLTYLSKTHLPSWSNLLSEVQHEVERRGHVKDLILSGLL